MNARTSLALLGLLLSTQACMDRDDVWEREPAPIPSPLAGRSTVVVLDTSAERALAFNVDGNLEIDPVSIPIGRNVPSTGVAKTQDGSKLLVLSRGDVPRKSAKAQRPALQVIDGDKPVLLGRYELDDAFSTLSVDPRSRFAVISAGSTDTTVVTNPNELIVVDLDAPPSPSNPTALTLRSFGGRPEQLDFTPPLSIAGATRRLLVAHTDRDLALLDLDDLSRPDITVRLTGGSANVTPEGFAVTDGDPARDDDARIAIRLAGDPNVVIIDLLPPTADTPTDAAFRPTPNIIGLSAPASDIAFVKTDQGERLAALVPTARKLSLIEPLTGIITDIALDAPFDQLSLVTAQAGGNDSGDIALLRSSTSPAIAFVTLGTSIGTPYKSVHQIELEMPTPNMLDIPAPGDGYKLLYASNAYSSALCYVLDVRARTVAPLQTPPHTRLTVSPDGTRVWATQGDSSNLGFIDLASRHPSNVLIERPILHLVDVTRTDGGRAVVTTHASGAMGLTILDAKTPSLSNAREYAGFLLGEL